MICENNKYFHFSLFIAFQKNIISNNNTINYFSSSILFSTQRNYNSVIKSQQAKSS